MGGTAGHGNEGREKNFDSKIESEGNMEECYGCDLVLMMKDTQRSFYEQEWTEEKEKLSSVAERTPGGIKGRATCGGFL